MRLVFCLLFMFLSPFAWALTCPLPQEIRQGNLHGFTPIDIDNDLPVSARAARYFKAHVQSFLQAEWMQGTRYPSHCYYRLNDVHGWSQVFLGHRRDKAPAGFAWHQIMAGIARCWEGTSTCIF